jgi:hypothetical protein
MPTGSSSSMLTGSRRCLPPPFLPPGAQALLCYSWLAHHSDHQGMEVLIRRQPQTSSNNRISYCA